MKKLRSLLIAALAGRSQVACNLAFEPTERLYSSGIFYRCRIANPGK